LSTRKRIGVVPLANYSAIAEELRQILPNWEANVIQTNNGISGTRLGMELWSHRLDSLSYEQRKNLMVFLMRYLINQG